MNFVIIYGQFSVINLWSIFEGCILQCAIIFIELSFNIGTDMFSLTALSSWRRLSSVNTSFQAILTSSLDTTNECGRWSMTLQ